MAQKRYEARCDANGDVQAIVDPETGRDISVPIAASAGHTPARRGTGLLPELATEAAVKRERDQLLDAAVHDGRIAASERKDYRAMYDRDPISTKLLLAKLAPDTTRSGTGLLPELDQ